LTLSVELKNRSGSGLHRVKKKLTKRLKVVEAFRKSENKPDWISWMSSGLPPD